MDGNRFDAITRLFAGHRFSRRQALAQAGAGIAAGALAATGLTASAVAQDTAQDEAAADKDGPMMLFLQAFQSGSIVPKEGAADRYILTLEQGLGHTVYFSDRPDRIVGAAPTPKFLEGLGFPDDNPPNAALVVEGEGGETGIAVLELFSPSYDLPTRTATYEVAVLADWERQGQAGDSGGAVFSETTADLAQQFPQFGAAHLFIDDCPDAAPLQCYKECGSDPVANLGTRGMCWSWDDWTCHPCAGDWQGTAFECGFDFAVCIGGCFTDHWGVCGTAP